ncbi:hypothetical protein D3C78_666220 [compost metagenome]
MDISLRVGQHLGSVQRGLRLFIEMQEQSVGKGRGSNALDKGGALAGTGTVVQLEIRPRVSQMLGHAQDRGDADAASKQ